MLTTESYFMAWGIYLLGCGGMLVLVWHLSEPLRNRELRKLLRLSAAVLLLTPYTSNPPESLLAPALVIAVLEGVFQGFAALARAGLPLLVTWLIVLMLTLLLELVWRRHHRNA